MYRWHFNQLSHPARPTCFEILEYINYSCRGKEISFCNPETIRLIPIINLNYKAFRPTHFNSVFSTICVFIWQFCIYSCGSSPIPSLPFNFKSNFNLNFINKNEVIIHLLIYLFPSCLPQDFSKSVFILFSLVSILVSF